MSKFATVYRTHTCGELRADDAGGSVKLAGAVDRRLEGRGLLLRDAFGKTLIEVGEAAPEAVQQAFAAVGPEDIVQVEGEVRKRKTPSQSLDTGEIAVHAAALATITKARELPFRLDDEDQDPEERLRFRHLDLRRPAMQERLRFRFEAAMAIRNWLTEEGFCEVDTPALERWSAELTDGYVVPGQPGYVFALPSHARAHSQLLMVSGFERTFQLGRSFRRLVTAGPLEQHEFTALEATLAYVDLDDVLALGERLLGHLAEQAHLPKLETPLPRLTHDEALRRFGSAAPDLAAGPELQDIGGFVALSSAEAFLGANEDDGGAYAIRLPGAAERFKTSELGELTTLAEGAGAARVHWFKVGGAGALAGPEAEHVEDLVRRPLLEALGAEEGDLLLTAAADPWSEAAKAAGALRVELARRTGLRGEGPAAVWVTDLPYVAYDPATYAWVRARSPWVRPTEEHLETHKDPDGARLARGRAAKLAFRGVEVAGASVWNHDVVHFREVCRMLGYDDDTIETTFGPVLDAFRFGVPPHAGLRLGLDRVVAALLGLERIDEVIAFPKTAEGEDLLFGAPSPADERNIRDQIEPE